MIPGLPDGIYFQTKNPDWGKFCIERRMSIWSILQLFSKMFGRLAYFMVILYIFPILLCCTEKNLATLLETSVPFPQGSIGRSVDKMSSG
jgi:hypothetical protein